MSATALRDDARRASIGTRAGAGPIAAAAVAAAILFAEPMATLVRDWWTDSNAGYGLLLAPLAVWLAWRAGLAPDRAPNVWLGTALLALAVLLRYLGGLAAEQFTLRFSMVVAAAGLAVFAWGTVQVRRWWLPLTLFALSIPLPVVVTNTLALPLQLKASAIGAALLEWRQVPVRLAGNIIQLPGRQLFVTEACSGLRSLTALLSLGVLLGGISLRTWVGRALLVAVAIPVAIVVNAIRVFLTGFLVYFADPKLGEGFIHLTEGWLLFIAAFALLGCLAWAAGLVESRLVPRRSNA